LEDSRYASLPVALLLLRLPSLVRVEAVGSALRVALGLALLARLPRWVPSAIAVGTIEALLGLRHTSRTTLRLARASTTRSTDIALSLTVFVCSLRRAALVTELSTAR
jgi:hypothetical protein